MGWNCSPMPIKHLPSISPAIVWAPCWHFLGSDLFKLEKRGTYSPEMQWFQQHGLTASVQGEGQEMKTSSCLCGSSSLVLFLFLRWLFINVIYFKALFQNLLPFSWLSIWPNPLALPVLEKWKQTSNYSSACDFIKGFPSQQFWVLKWCEMRA